MPRKTAKKTVTQSRAPKAPDVSVRVKLSAEETARLRDLAERNGVNVPDLIHEALVVAGFLSATRVGEEAPSVTGTQRLDLECPGADLRKFAGLTLAEAAARVGKYQGRRCAPTTVHGTERTGEGVSVRSLRQRAEAYGIDLEIRVRK